MPNESSGLVPAVSGGLASYPVSTAVNNVRNNGPELREPADGQPSPPGPHGEPEAAPPGSEPSGGHPPHGASATGETLF